MWFGSALPPEESRITPGGNLPPVWEPLLYKFDCLPVLLIATE